MIVVLADDLSGAAELANAAVRHGLVAEVQTHFHPETIADVVCVDLATRLLPATEAARRARETAEAIAAVRPAWIFHKCDSVLRGSPLAEARAIASAFSLRHLVVIPANPSRQRIIRNGTYFINGRSLHETDFARDPTHPRLVSDVKSLLGSDLAGVEVPDVESSATIAAIAARVGSGTLPVGAVDFFSTLLAQRTPRGSQKYAPVLAAGPTLVVCGSAASWPLRQAEAGSHGVPVFTLSGESDEIRRTLAKDDCVLLGIGDGPATQGKNPDQLVGQLARLAADVMSALPVQRLLLEGGATAAATLAALGWQRLRVESVGESGVGILRPVDADGPLLFIKPGSYPWPAGSWP
jgi:uncharacterized protein YgbK (DUF1537 family)